jgi:hypothetical protein
VQALVREVGHPVSNELTNEFQKRHAGISEVPKISQAASRCQRSSSLSERDWYTLGGRCERATREGPPAVLALEIAAEVPINTRGQAERAKADPDISSGRGGCTRYTYREYSDAWESSWMRLRSWTNPRN